MSESSAPGGGGAPRLGRRLALGLGLAGVATIAAVVVLIGAMGGAAPTTPGSSAQATLPPVVVVDEVVADGVVLPSTRAELASETGGTVATVAVALGDRVESGDDLVTLDDTALAAELEGARYAAEAAEARASQAEALVTQAEAQLAVAQANLDGASAALATARDANVREKEAEAARAAASAQVDLARAALEAARDALTAAAADAAAAGSAARAIEDRKAALTLTAPFAGVVASLPVRAGQVVSPGEILVRIADPSAWEFVATELDEGGIARVRIGAAATVVLDGLPGIEIPGTVARVGSFGEARQGGIVYEVVVVASGIVPDGVAWNMTATISIAVAR